MMMKESEIEAVANEVLSANLANHGFRGSDVSSETDFDGGSIIRVVAHYTDGEVPSDAVIKSLHEIRSRLIDSGEERFVILSGKYDTEQDEDNDEVEE